MNAKRKTISPQDVLEAMKEMEFERFGDKLKQCLEGECLWSPAYYGTVQPFNTFTLIRKFVDIYYTALRSLLLGDANGAMVLLMVMFRSLQAGAEGAQVER